MEDKISVADLNVSFGTNDIIKGLNLNIAKGENLCVIGGSGSGKSVLIKSIIGLIKKNSGTIKINGTEVDENVVENAKKHDISMTFQNDGLFDSMNIMQNLCFALLKKKKIKAQKAISIARNAIKAIRLKEDVLDVYPHELSGGMKKRIAIARAIITLPKIIFFDEPTTGLDPITSYKITSMIYDYIKAKDTTSITITHSINCAQKLADKIAVMKDGKIIWHDDAKKIKDCTDLYIKDFLAYA